MKSKDLVAALMPSIEKEVSWETSRSGGPGGQHANKVETRVVLVWLYNNSTLLSKKQKAQITDRLSTYITKEGSLKVSCEADRSQSRNKTLAIAKLQKLLRHAFHKPKKRKLTRPSAASVRERRKHKEHRSRIKSLRSKPKLD